jgi:hypothetical protein
MAGGLVVYDMWSTGASGIFSGRRWEPDGVGGILLGVAEARGVGMGVWFVVEEREKGSGRR